MALNQNKNFKLNVLYQSNDDYAEVTGISMISLFKNNQHFKEINIFYLDDGISAQNKEKLSGIACYYQRKLHFIETSSILERLKAINVVPYKGTYTTYFKLFALNDLDLVTDYVLQIDGDTIIDGPLDGLFKLKLENKLCAATYDLQLNEYKTLIGLAKNDPYYNCGVLFINQKNWILDGCEDKIIKHLINTRNRYFIVDQDIINVLFRDKIIYLDIKYNFNPGFYLYGIKANLNIYRTHPYNSIEEIRTAMQKPIVYHCMGAMTGRPWEQNNIHPQNDIYNRYRSSSPWNNLPKMVHKYSMLFRIQRLLYKTLPIFLYWRIHKFTLKLWLYKKNEEALRG